MDFTDLIIGRTEALPWRGTESQSVACRAHSRAPSQVAMKLQEFSAPHQTMTTVGNQVRLRRTPPLERRRPFLRTLQVEDLAAPSSTLQ